MAEYEIEFYENSNGEEPAKQFIENLDIKLRAKVLSNLTILGENGPALREPYSKHLTDGIFELRTKLGTNATRILYFFYIDKHIILTNGFVKRTSKTPRSEIEKARKCRADYLRQKETSNGNKV